MRHTWVPVFGEFEVGVDLITFKGRQMDAPAPATPRPAQDNDDAVPQQTAPVIGTLLSNRTLTNGMVRADVKFSAGASDSACELIIGYDVESRGQISAGITGSNWAA